MVNYGLNITEAAMRYNTNSGITTLYIDAQGRLVLDSVSNGSEWKNYAENSDSQVLAYKKAGSREQIPVSLLYRYVKRYAKHILRRNYV